MMSIIKYYQSCRIEMSYSKLLELNSFDQSQLLFRNSTSEKLVEIISYCLMPSHFHLVLRQLMDNGISIFISNICNSYTRYFNLKHNRKGPLWQGRFKNVLVENDEQLLHLTRYIHHNPVTSNFVDDPSEWAYSSYKEYIQDTGEKLCKFDILDIKPGAYKRFVLSQKDYQKRLHIIKKQIIE